MQFEGAGAVEEALDALHVGLDHLVKLVEDRGLETFDDTQLVGFLHGFERLRNRLPLVDHQVINEAGRGACRTGCVRGRCRGCWPPCCESRSRRRPAGSGPRRHWRSG